MNSTQIISIVKTILNAVMGSLVAKGVVDQSGAETIVAGVIIIATAIYSHFQHSDKNINEKTN